MTEWNGIKVGGLYKLAAGRRRPLALVVGLEELTDARLEGGGQGRVQLTMLEDGELHKSWLALNSQRNTIYDYIGDWPWQEVA